jgi:hypothetical protein
MVPPASVGRLISLRDPSGDVKRKPAMTWTTTVKGSSIPAEDYAEILDFYARHVRLLDNYRAEEFADQFTEDAVFGQNVKPEPKRGRDAIATSMRRGMDRLAERGVVRRHWFGMVSAEPADDGAVRTSYYAVVFETPPGGGTPSVYLSTTAEDVLVRESGRWLVRSRNVVHDGT